MGCTGLSADPGSVVDQLILHAGSQILIDMQRVQDLYTVKKETIGGKSSCPRRLCNIYVRRISLQAASLRECQYSRKLQPESAAPKPTENPSSQYSIVAVIDPHCPSTQLIPSACLPQQHL